MIKSAGKSLLFYLGFLLVASPAWAGPPPLLTLNPAAGALEIDGRLLEDAWRQAASIADLVQQDPSPGQPTSFTTEIRALVDAGGLTFAFICHDPDPRAVAVHTMERDGDLEGDDTVTLVLDTFGDRRGGYLFKINAAGARLDGLITGPEDTSLDWDGIWYAATNHTADGWTAEIRIPAQTLRFPAQNNRWGVNFERHVARNRLTLRWSDSSRNAQLSDLRRSGVLSGVALLKQGHGLSLSPYGSFHLDHDPGTDHHQGTGSLGGDASWNITSGLKAAVTINTDFAETEVDSRRINLTRFPLFFPEKRDFFLEGSDQFEFGAGLGRDFVPFFSRRIGLYAGQQVPLDLGAKILGRSGPWSLAFLESRTGATENTAAANLFTGRLTRDLNRHLTIGVLATHGAPDGHSDNSLGGLDASWQTSTLAGDKNFSAGVWLAANRGPGPAGRKNGWGLKLDYPNDLIDMSFIYRDFGSGLNPALGFLPRPGTRWFLGGLSIQPRPEGRLSHLVRQFFFEFYPRLIRDLNGQTQSWRIFTAPINLETQSGEHLEFNYAPQYEWIPGDFEISDGVTIPGGGYRFDRFRGEIESSPHRRLTAGSSVWFGEFYTGTLTQWEASVAYSSPGGHWQMRLETENNFGDLPQGSFIERLYQLRGVYAFNPGLILTSNLQYDSDTRNLGTNLLLRWTIQPGNDLYLVWTQSYQRPGDPADWHLLRSTEDHLALKLRWTLRY